MRLLVKIETPDGEFAHPTIDNTIGWLREHSVGHVQTIHDVDRMLANIDRSGTDYEHAVVEEAREKAREGSERLYDKGVVEKVVVGRR